MREERHNSKMRNLNYDSHDTAYIFDLYSDKNDIFLPAKLTARGQYVVLLHQAKYECFDIKSSVL